MKKDYAIVCRITFATQENSWMEQW